MFSMNYKHPSVVRAKSVRRGEKQAIRLERDTVTISCRDLYEAWILF